MRWIRWICLILILLPLALSAQGSLDDYRRAEGFLPKNIDRLIFRTHVSPHWIEKTSQFWYRNDIREGKEFVFVDAEKNIRRRAFDHKRLAGSLSGLLNKEVEAFDLPFDSFEYTDKGESIAFKVDTLFLECDLKNYQCIRSEPKEKDKPEESKSPDGKWIAFIKNFNSYKNLGDIGAEDHIGGLKQLADRYPCMDLTRVGIYGHSAGGYDAAHAMLTHPEFYRVGVASAGNHDHQMAKAWWPEHWMGFPVGDHYVEQSNLSLAGNLKGKLLLVHGDMDNNVNPASTLRLAGEFIKANKDFDLLIIPNRRHGLGDDPYFIRKRWDYFVEYLLGVEPPREYRIKVFDEKTP